MTATAHQPTTFTPPGPRHILSLRMKRTPAREVILRLADNALAFAVDRDHRDRPLGVGQDLPAGTDRPSGNRGAQIAAEIDNHQRLASNLKGEAFEFLKSAAELDHRARQLEASDPTGAAAFQAQARTARFQAELKARAVQRHEASIVAKREELAGVANRGPGTHTWPFKVVLPAVRAETADGLIERPRLVLPMVPTHLEHADLSRWADDSDKLRGPYSLFALHPRGYLMERGRVPAGTYELFRDITARHEHGLIQRAVA